MSAVTRRSQPSNGRSPLPDRFYALGQQISLSWVGHQSNPTGFPLYRIGRFEALRPRGRGNFGALYEVHHPELGCSVLIEMVAVADRETADAFRREVEALRALSYRHIVRVFESGSYGDDVFVVMELIEGIDGHAFISDSVDMEEVLEVYEAAGTALAIAHDQGVLHRDFHPACIRLGEGRICVGDFGLSGVLLDPAGEAKLQVCERSYSAPEVLRGGRGDARSDQWSYCASLWETLHAIPPYAGPTSDQLLEAIERGEPELGDDRRAAVPDALRSVIRVGLACDPNDRYPDMRALLTALQPFRRSHDETDDADQGKLPRGPFLWALLLVFASVLGAVSYAVATRERVRVERGASEAQPSSTMPSPREPKQRSDSSEPVPPPPRTSMPASQWLPL